MSEWKCEVVKVKQILKHPNADSLGMTNVYDYPVIVKLGEINEGDLAVYVPVESVAPADERFAFLGSRKRIKAKKLRGVFSMGLLLKAEEGMVEGEDAAAKWNITKYEEPEVGVSKDGNVITGGDSETVPFLSVRYEVENLRRHANSIGDGEEVVITEKIHGCNSRFIYFQDRLWCGSHNTWKKPEDANLWWRMAKQYGLDQKLKDAPNMVFYGETFGWIQDLRYGMEQGQALLRFFDIFDLQTGAWLDWDKASWWFQKLDLPVVPVLFRGPWSKDLTSMAEELSTLANNMREGIVVKPVKERFDLYVGRPILKYVSKQYLLREKGSEGH